MIVVTHNCGQALRVSCMVYDDNICWKCHQTVNLTVLQYMLVMHNMCHFWSIEKQSVASNAEIKRWIQQKAILINGKPRGLNDLVDCRVESLVLFPKSNNRKIVI